MATKQDFRIIKSLVSAQKSFCEKLTTSKTFDQSSNIFYYVALKLLYNLKDEEVDKCITDQSYLMQMGRPSGKESGIDAIYIEESAGYNIVNLFTFKYTEKENSALESFSSSVIDNVLFYIDILTNGDMSQIPADYNDTLKNYTKHIFSLIEENNVSFKVHLCGNFDRLDPNEKIRFENKIASLPLFSIEYDFMDRLVSLYIDRNRVKIGGKIVVSKGEYFVERTDDGLCKTLIAKVDALMLLKLISKDNKLRNKTKCIDDDFINYEVDERAFDDNVRIFLGNSKINNRILDTIKVDKENFYFYNNGITILIKNCKEGTSSKTTFTLEDIQIVNGSQTIHNLVAACKQNISNLIGVSLLCRFYTIDDHRTHSNIAEFTNSQHQVKARDIKALDIRQIKLEHEFELLGIKYERKKDQFKGSRGTKVTRLDSEKCGKILAAFYTEDAATARNDTEQIFTTKYDSIFSDNICANEILTAKTFFDYIEQRRKRAEKQLSDNEAKYLLHIKYSRYFYLFAMKKVCDKYFVENSIPQYNSREKDMPDMYDLIHTIYSLVTLLKLKSNPNLDLSNYFKSNAAQKDFLDILEKINSSSLLEAKEQAINLLQNELGK